MSKHLRFDRFIIRQADGLMLSEEGRFRWLPPFTVIASKEEKQDRLW
ncbi:MAG TPA: hypothetical protein VKT82_03645 [Ktedonobacterales bacterium]|nr:hypothetical protein [Ktedonobacterales bacterium]